MKTATESPRERFLAAKKFLLEKKMKASHIHFRGVPIIRFNKPQLMKIIALAMTAELKRGSSRDSRLSRNDT